MAEFFEEIADWQTPPTYKYFYGGKWLTSKSGKTAEVVSPVDGTILGRTQIVTKWEIDLAIEAAKKCQREWDKVSVDKRAKILHLVADWIREHQVYLTILLIKEIGKTTSEAKDEVLRTADLIDYFAEAARAMRGETLDADSFPGYEKGKLAIIEKAPRGVVLAISPFNYPINLSASKIAPALVCGNAVIFKPSSQGAICGLHLTEIFHRAGVPDGLLSTITGSGQEIGDYLITHPGIDMISFTGSSKVGLEIAKKAGMIPLLFECGGNNPAIVLTDADLNLAALEIVKGAFSYSGQRCTAVKYVLGLSATIDKLIPKLLKLTAEQVKMGDPRVETTKLVGPVINRAAAEEIENRIIKAKVEGGKILLGGKRKGLPAGRQGLYIEPTIIDNADPRMEIVKIETFGPVLSLIRVKNMEEAIEIVNSSTYGLQASIFTKDEGTGIALAKKLNVGTVQINSKPQRGPDHFPFLGIKGSGVGVQGVRYTLEAMTRPKPVVLNKPE